ncbi:MAG: hypothetical protein R6U96_04065 [Promethearchaeia archaeon]
MAILNKLLRNGEGKYLKILYKEKGTLILHEFELKRKSDEIQKEKAEI